jgi:hypothetical protein
MRHRVCLLTDPVPNWAPQPRWEMAIQQLQPRTRFYFVRHGESVAKLQRVFSNRDLPHGLTATGRAQVKRLADRLVGIRFASIHVSPVLRARHYSSNGSYLLVGHGTTFMCMLLLVLSNVDVRFAAENVLEHAARRSRPRFPRITPRSLGSRQPARSVTCA